MTREFQSKAVLMEALPHPRQAERIRALHAYEILDTDREKDFDDVVKLASRICGASISIVNFIDTSRQWFKAETGLGTRETPLATSLCSHAILEEDFVEIHDTLEDPRMVDNPLCCGDPGLRFYAGAILKTPDGLPLGTLCVLDYEPRTLTPLQRDTIKVLANQVMTQLEMRRALKVNYLLRQEVDHRVKNSLLALASLIRLQTRQATSEETNAALTTVLSRIEAVATVHEQLYHTDAGFNIDLQRYLRNLADHFSAMAPKNIDFDLDLEPIEVSSQQAVAVGTLVNEFVANSIKHAFPDGRPGRVGITIGHARDGQAIRLECTDDGVGFGEDVKPDNGGLGMQIARVITSDLQCALNVTSTDSGVTIALEFDRVAS